MARTTHDRPSLDQDQATALEGLRSVFGAQQVTVIDLQPTGPPEPDPIPTTTSAQASLLEEAS